MISPYALQKYTHNRDVTGFAKEVLGLQIHEGQDYWFRNSWKPIDILKPANQWGKTTAISILHIFHAVCKPLLDRFTLDYREWFGLRYETLNVGKSYEVAKGVLETVQDITNGNYLLPDGTLNKSLLKGWAIKNITDTPKLPGIEWWNNSVTLIRSYDGLGESFKRKKLAYISSDECGDIQELRLFLNGTMLPRTFFYKGCVHLIGTSQPKGLEYEELAEIAEEDMKLKGMESDYFIISYNSNPDMACVYTNKYMPTDHIRKLEAVADPELKNQIIYGKYVDWSKHLYTWDEVSQMFTEQLPYDKETGFTEAPVEHGQYVFAVDLAASEDETSMTCIRHGITQPGRGDVKIELPHRIVFHKAWKGASLPLHLQYEMIKEYFMKFKRVAPMRTKFVYDAGSLGGKNAGEAFKELNGYPFPPKGRSYAEIKAEAMGRVKEVLGRGRKFRIDETGKSVDTFPDWGGIRASSKLLELRRQLEVASKDDDKLKNDQFSSFMMGLHFIEARSPKSSHAKAIDFNYMRGLNC